MDILTVQVHLIGQKCVGSIMNQQYIGSVQRFKPGDLYLCTLDNSCYVLYAQWCLNEPGRFYHRELCHNVAFPGTSLPLYILIKLLL